VTGGSEPPLINTLGERLAGGCPAGIREQGDVQAAPFSVRSGLRKTDASNSPTRSARGTGGEIQSRTM